MGYFGSLFRAAFVCAGILAAVAAGTGPVCAENSAGTENMNSGSGLAESGKAYRRKTDSGKDGRRARKLAPAEEASQQTGSRRQRISLSLDLAALRDSISAMEQRNLADLKKELDRADSVAYDSLMRAFAAKTRIRPVFNPSSGSYLGDLAVSIAYEHLGKPYKWGAEGPEAFDCSGFVMYCFRQLGYRLPRTSREMYREGAAVDIPELKKGDLVFWSGRRGSVGATIGHVGIVADVDYDRGFFYFIHANSGGGGVTVSRSDERYFLLHYKGARRIIPLDRN